MINFLMNQRETYLVNVNINKEVNLHVMNIIFKTSFNVPFGCAFSIENCCVNI